VGGHDLADHLVLAGELGAQGLFSCSSLAVRESVRTLKAAAPFSKKAFC